MPGFRLAFVGESNRGKSTLINRLFDRPLLPVGALPNKTTVTLISAGPQERMEVSFPDNRRESRPLEESSWDDLLPADQAASDQEVLAKVIRLTVDSYWLRNLDAELVDTPGAGDEPGGQRAAIIFEILSSCDAAVLLVSATSPFSRTESAFLQEELIGRHVPRILVVVSNLDRIDKEERDSVLGVVRERVAEASPAISVLPSHPVDGATPTAALEVVRTEIEALVARGDRRVWRSRQIAAQTADYLYQIIEFGKARAAAVQMDAAERKEELRKARNELRTAELQWEGLRLELDRRRLTNYQQMRSRILATKPDLLEELTMELRRTPDPRAWWENELPLKLQQQLIAGSHMAQEFVTATLARDFDWLQGEVARSFGTEMASGAQETGELGIEASLGQLPADDLGRWQILAKFGMNVTQMVSRFSGPAALAISFALRTAGRQYKDDVPAQQSQAAEMGALAQLIQAALEGGVQLGSGFMNDLLNSKVDEQRKMIARKLERTLDRAYEDYSERMSERMRQLYDQVSEDTKREQVAWRSARISALEGDDGSSGEQTWRGLIDDSIAVRKEILAALER